MNRIMLMAALLLGGVLLLGACESNTIPGANEDPNYRSYYMGGP